MYFMWKNMEQPDRAQVKIQYGCMTTQAGVHTHTHTHTHKLINSVWSCKMIYGNIYKDWESTRLLICHYNLFSWTVFLRKAMNTETFCCGKAAFMCNMWREFKQIRCSISFLHNSVACWLKLWVNRDINYTLYKTMWSSVVRASTFINHLEVSRERAWNYSIWLEILNWLVKL